MRKQLTVTIALTLLTLCFSGGIANAQAVPLEWQFPFWQYVDDGLRAELHNEPVHGDFGWWIGDSDFRYYLARDEALYILTTETLPKRDEEVAAYVEEVEQVVERNTRLRTQRTVLLTALGGATLMTLGGIFIW